MYTSATTICPSSPRCKEHRKIWMGRKAKYNKERRDEIGAAKSRSCEKSLMWGVKNSCTRGVTLIGCHSIHCCHSLCVQAMDRCHRIGQSKPVLVLRLATSHSVEGKMLRRASNKMALTRLVIKKGAFRGDKEAKSARSSLASDELLQLLKADISLDDVPQSGEVSDDIMDQLLDRTDDVTHARIPAAGVGYEIVQQQGCTDVLSTVTRDEPYKQVDEPYEHVVQATPPRKRWRSPRRRVLSPRRDNGVGDIGNGQSVSPGRMGTRSQGFGRRGLGSGALVGSSSCRVR
ncbi:unnamed protein product [Ostreobium quekettii]|uniref:Helicase C-terminal domain-containing protein n=1 Tax=Ostreobium quekettii TaxID=121088 RepID=A0A8S1JFX6_9CHLO|nr:unnamed protein product [Ostreobium quekettii]